MALAVTGWLLVELPPHLASNASMYIDVLLGTFVVVYMDFLVQLKLSSLEIDFANDSACFIFLHLFFMRPLQLESAMKAAESAQATLQADRASLKASMITEEEFKSLQLQVFLLKLLLFLYVFLLMYFRVYK